MIKSARKSSKMDQNQNDGELWAQIYYKTTRSKAFKKGIFRARKYPKVSS